MKYTVLLLAFFSLILILCIFQWGDYLIKNNYIVECFGNVDMPLNNKYD